MYAVKIVSKSKKKIDNLKDFYHVDHYKNAVYVRYPSKDRAKKGVVRIKKKYGLSGKVVKVIVKFDNVIGEEK